MLRFIHVYFLTCLLFITLSSTLPAAIAIPSKRSLPANTPIPGTLSLVVWVQRLIPIVNDSSNPLQKYIIEYCYEDQILELSAAIDTTLVGAALAYRDATHGQKYGFIPFFKITNSPVVNLLANIAGWRPSGLLQPRFACVTQDTSQYFPDIVPSVEYLCDVPPFMQALVIRGYNTIFICADFWTLPREPRAPQAVNCPSVTNNLFSSSISRYRSNAIIDALIHYRLQAEKLELPGPSTLNQMVGLSAMMSYLSASNYDSYLHSNTSFSHISASSKHLIVAKNECTEWPDIRFPPWSQGLVSNSSLATANSTDFTPQSVSVLPAPLTTAEFLPVTASRYGVDAKADGR